MTSIGDKDLGATANEILDNVKTARFAWVPTHKEDGAAALRAFQTLKPLPESEISLTQLAFPNLYLILTDTVISCEEADTCPTGLYTAAISALVPRAGLHANLQKPLTSSDDASPLAALGATTQTVITSIVTNPTTETISALGKLGPSGAVQFQTSIDVLTDVIRTAHSAISEKTPDAKSQALLMAASVRALPSLISGRLPDASLDNLIQPLTDTEALYKDPEAPLAKEIKALRESVLQAKVSKAISQQPQ